MGTGTMEKRISLKKMLFAIWIVTLGMFLVLFFCYTGYIVTYYRDRDAEESRKLENSYAEKLDGDLESMFRNVELIYSEDVNYDKLSHGGLTEFDSYGTLYLLKNTLANYANSASWMGAMYYFDLDNEIFRFAWNERPFSGSGNLLLRETKVFLKETIQSHRNMGHFCYAGELYLSYSYGRGGHYVGALMNLSRYYDAQEEYGIIFEERDGTVLAKAGNALPPQECASGHEKYLETQSYVQNCGLDLILIQKERTLYELVSGSRLWIFMVLIFLFFGCYLYLLLKGLNRLLLQPVEYLASKCSEIQEPGSGKREVTHIVEVDNINQRMERMLTDIVRLREEKYQEKLRTNAAQLQYYQLQINPHFFLNCLNTINSLLDRKRPEAVRDMVFALSAHFRYVFRDHRELVPVEEEIKEVGDICKIYTLKGGIPILLNADVQERAKSCLLPILAIQTFVENSIKHVKKNGLLLNINIQVRLRQEEGQTKGLYLRIADNGNGYSPEILERLNEKQCDFRYQSSQVGIDNLKYRMRLLYGDHMSISFSNAPLGGAVTEIFLGELTDEYSDHRR